MIRIKDSVAHAYAFTLLALWGAIAEYKPLESCLFLTECSSAMDRLFTAGFPTVSCISLSRLGFFPFTIQNSDLLFSWRYSWFSPSIMVPEIPNHPLVRRMESYSASQSFPQLLHKQTFLVIAKHLPRKLRERGDGTSFFFTVLIRERLKVMPYD